MLELSSRRLACARLQVLDWKQASLPLPGSAIASRPVTALHQGYATASLTLVLVPL